MPHITTLEYDYELYYTKHNPTILYCTPPLWTLREHEYKLHNTVLHFTPQYCNHQHWTLYDFTPHYSKYEFELYYTLQNPT